MGFFNYFFHIFSAGLVLNQTCQLYLTVTSLFCSFNAGSQGSDGAGGALMVLPGLLMEEGIKLLKESAKRPECIVNIRGFVI